jgi:dihydrofolate reductase
VNVPIVSRPRITLVAAVARNGVIGNGNQLPWHLPADLKRFKSLTLGHPILMGRRTYESIGGPLPGRRNLVLTQQRDWRAAGTETVPTLADAFAAAADGELMVIGGAAVYAATLPYADRLELTEIDADVPGDTFFPPLARQQWRELARETHAPDERNALPYAFVTLARSA